MQGLFSIHRNLSTVLQNQVLKSLLSCFPEKTTGEGSTVAVVPQVIPVVNTSELSLDKLAPFLKELKSGKPIEGLYSIVCTSSMCV